MSYNCVKLIPLVFSHDDEVSKLGTSFKEPCVNMLVPHINMNAIM